MRKLMVVATGAVLLASHQVHADVVGLGANVSYWDSGLSGQAATGGDLVDLENDLNLDSDSNANSTLYLEHPIPVLPNVRVNYTQIQLDGTGQVSVDFDGISAGANVQSELDIQQLDLTLYYEVLDNWVNLDLGLTARDLSGELTVSESAANKSETKIDAVVPMGYLAARFDLPFTGVSVGAEGNFISFDGDSVHDFNAYGQYEISVLQLRAGYRQMAIDYEDDSDRLDVELDGPFISAGVAF